MSERENEKVIDELRRGERSKRKRQRYCVWAPTQRAEIGKNAAEHGNAPTVTAVGLKYPGLGTPASSEPCIPVADNGITEIVREKPSRPRCYSNT